MVSRFVLEYRRGSTGAWIKSFAGQRDFATRYEAECVRRFAGYEYRVREVPGDVLAEATLAAAVKADPPRTPDELREKFLADNPPCDETCMACAAINPDTGARKLPTPAADADRKALPVWTGVVRYFPSALLEVSKVSKAGNDQHNPGQPLHWAQGKSMNQTDTAMRHLLDADACEGTPDELAHLAQAAWRVLARLQLACQREGAPMAPGARAPGGDMAVTRETPQACSFGCDRDCVNAAPDFHGVSPGWDAPSTIDSFAAWHAEVARLGKHYDPAADTIIKDCLGLAGEVGEVVDIIKKDRYQAQPLDREKLKNEIGDVLWYLTNLTASLGMTLQEVAESNSAKLRKRYPDGFVPGGGMR